MKGWRWPMAIILAPVVLLAVAIPAFVQPPNVQPPNFAWVWSSSRNPSSEVPAQLPILLIINSAGEKVPVRVEVADTPQESQRGLMNRTTLEQDAGMLFVYDQERLRSFWMKNTLIPLSIAYIDAEGRIVDIQDMQPLDETPHPSAEPARYALEVNQGFFDERGVMVGDMVDLGAFVYFD